MKIAKLNLLMVSVTVLALSACATIDQKMMDAGATRLNGAQVKSHLIGMTEIWSKGGGFYGSNGKMEVVWEGSKQPGTWEVADDGVVCYKIPIWKRNCHHYLNDKGTITLMWQGRPSVKEMFNGNQLANL
jgi:hypothetical protein